jgi:hypothetical protein
MTMARVTRRPAARTRSTALAALALVGVTAAPSFAQEVTVWDGVYTEAQARRGEERYKAICGYCHRDDLSGGGSEAGAPTLAGAFFTTQWEDSQLVDLFVTIGTTMPKNEPDSLMPQVVIDILSFLLQANEIPAGDTELPPELAPLEEILFTEKPQR